MGGETLSTARAKTEKCRAAMPLYGRALVSTSREIIASFGSVSFFMADEESIVRVDVSRELLTRLESPSPKSTKQYISSLSRYQRYFQEIAGAKYDDGEYEPEGRVLVVRITDADLTLV
jgi:hypothetical protein